MTLIECNVNFGIKKKEKKRKYHKELATNCTAKKNDKKNPTLSIASSQLNFWDIDLVS